MTGGNIYYKKNCYLEFGQYFRRAIEAMALHGYNQGCHYFLVLSQEE